MSINYISSSAYIVNTIKGARIINFNLIMYFKANGRYTWLIGTDEKLLVTKNIGLIEKEVLHACFARIHKSTLVNIRYIDKFNRCTRELTLKDGTKLKVSRCRKQMFKNNLPLVTRNVPLVT